MLRALLILLVASAGYAQTIHVINSPRLTNQIISPSDISGLRLWLKADSITASDGDAIETWEDSGPDNKDATQVTAGSRPVFTNAVAAIGGKPALYFDGSADNMTVASLALQSYCTVFVVFQGYGGHPATLLIEHGPNANTTDGFFFFGDSGDAWRMRRTSGHAAAGSTDNWAGASWITATFRYNGSGKYWKNGVEQGNGTVTGSDIGDTATTDTLNLNSRNGASLFERVNVAELIIFDGGLSDANVDAMHIYLRNEYGHY